MNKNPYFLQLYIIFIYNHEKIAKFIKYINIPEEYRLHINLLEASIPNRGKTKQIKNIPHCLISYACKQAFALGYDGFVSLYPKTKLIHYYRREYGFQQFGRQLAIYGKESFKLIKEYLDE